MFVFAPFDGNFDPSLGDPDTLAAVLVLIVAAAALGWMASRAATIMDAHPQRRPHGIRLVLEMLAALIALGVALGALGWWCLRQWPRRQ